MEISKLTFFEETKRQLNNPLLKSQKRTQLKRELVKHYIRSQPAGTPISINSLIRTALYDTKTKQGYQNGWAFVKTMEKNREIIKESIPNSSKSIWFIPGDAITTTPIEFDTDKYDTSKSFAKKTKESKTDKIVFNDENVAELAKEYYWQTSDDSLREFIKWVKERNLNA